LNQTANAGSYGEDEVIPERRIDNLTLCSTC
jgi:hypothetical protein